MQILLQALFSEAGGKKPELQETFSETDEEQVVFSELFFSEIPNYDIGKELEFEDNTNTVENWFAAEEQETLKGFKTEPDVEVLLPARNLQNDQVAQPLAPRMVDITPEDTVHENSALQPDFPEGASAPIVAPKLNPRAQFTNLELQTPVEWVRLTSPLASQSGPLLPSENGPAESKTPLYALPHQSESTPQFFENARGTNVLTDAFEPSLPTDPKSQPVNNGLASHGILEVDSSRVVQAPSEPIAEQLMPSAGRRIEPNVSSTTGSALHTVKATPIEHPSGLLKSERRLNDIVTVPTELPKQNAQYNMQSATVASELPLAVVHTPASEGKSNRDQNVELGTTLHSREVDDNRPQTPATTRAESAIVRPVVSQVIQMVMRLNIEGMVEVRLQPEELGRVRLAMTQFDAGVTVHITAERQDTLELLRRNIDMLESDLRDQGFENASFTFGQEGASKKEKDAEAISSGIEPEASLLLVDVNPQQMVTTDGHLDIRL